jgi:hypothetical protein
MKIQHQVVILLHTKHTPKFHTRDRIINISLVVSIYHKLLCTRNICPMYKKNVGEEIFSEII